MFKHLLTQPDKQVRQLQDQFVVRLLKSEWQLLNMLQSTGPKDEQAQQEKPKREKIPGFSYKEFMYVQVIIICNSDYSKLGKSSQGVSYDLPSVEDDFEFAKQFFTSMFQNAKVTLETQFLLN